MCRCSHFSMEVELRTLTTASVVLRLPVVRCALADQLKTDGLLGAPEPALDPDEFSDRTPAGQDVFLGPDGEVVHPRSCTVERWQNKCLLENDRLRGGRANAAAEDVGQPGTDVSPRLTYEPQR